MPDTTKLDPDDITDDEILTSICAGLVVIDEEQLGVGNAQPKIQLRRLGGVAAQIVELWSLVCSLAQHK